MVFEAWWVLVVSKYFADHTKLNYSFQVCGGTIIIGPLVYALYQFMMGRLTEDKLKLSVPTLWVWYFNFIHGPLVYNQLRDRGSFQVLYIWRLPYNITNVPVYIATSIVYAVPVNFWSFSMAAVDTFFLSVCLAFNGFFNDLMDMFAEVDNLVE